MKLTQLYVVSMLTSFKLINYMLYNKVVFIIKTVITCPYLFYLVVSLLLLYSQHKNFLQLRCCYILFPVHVKNLEHITKTCT